MLVPGFLGGWYRSGCWPGRYHLAVVLFPVVGVCAGALVKECAHVDLAEVDLAGVVGKPVDDGVRGDSVW